MRLVAGLATRRAPILRSIPPSSGASAPVDTGPIASSDVVQIGPLYPITPGIVFYSNAEDGAISDAELYNINPVTGAIDQLTFNNVDDRYPAWSPDHYAASHSVGGTGSRGTSSSTTSTTPSHCRS